jgi:hypothetical protein
MAEFYRILAGLMALFMQLLSNSPTFQLPAPIPPTATQVPPTATAPPPPTFTATLTPLPTATATATRFVTADPLGGLVTGVPPAQNQPSAFLIYPLVTTANGADTFIELLNVVNSPVSVHCVFVSAGTCRGLDFNVSLTALQPSSWTASTGRNSDGVRIAPPLLGQGELKCFVQPRSTALSAHNAIQGRALVNEAAGSTIGYDAIGIRRLTPGSFTGSLDLDGIEYEQCADRLHFQVRAQQAGSDSELILVPCTEDLELVRPTSTNVQLAVINEFEQHTSGSTSLNCFLRQPFSNIPALRRSSAGTDSIHVILRAVNYPVMGMVINRFPTGGGTSVSSNTPYLEGGRSADVRIP